MNRRIDIEKELLDIVEEEEKIIVQAVLDLKREKKWSKKCPRDYFFGQRNGL